MGAMFRSEEMALCQLFIQPEAAYSSVSMLGEIGIVQFRDLNTNVNNFHRKFVGEVRRCDELERKLRYIEREVCKDGVPIPEPQVVPKAPNPREIIDLEAHLEKTENDIHELTQNAVNMKSNFVELKELKHVLEKTQVFLTEQEEADSSRALIGGDDRGRLGFVAGVVQRERVHAFERMLWRISRGNVFLRQAELEDPIEDPATGNQIHKTVFVAFFQGENLKSRVKKVCAGFHASTYPCPSSSSERHEMLNGVRVRIEDLNMVLNQTRDHRQRVLSTVAKELHNWGVMVRKMKAIYHTLNMFNMDVTKKCLIGECWVPITDLPVLSKALEDGGKAVGSSISSFVNQIETPENPPTFIRTNKFTAGFQALVDAYGVASYREANPALYTIITFPFLFAVMFGDFGHGIIVTMFGAYMVLDEKKYMGKRGGGEVWNIFFGGRYIILLMGLFSMYTGLVYNDVFSLSPNLFGSAWTNSYNLSTLMDNAYLTLDPATDYAQFSEGPYFLGLDPVWQSAGNKIIFLNTFKMKLSIIVGVIHMIFGVCVGVINHVHFKKKINILLEFVPQLLFLVLLFGYMAFLMFYKWIVFKPTLDPSEFKVSPTCAPSVLITFINMMLFSKSESPKGCDEHWFPYQDEIQMALVLVALLCIPVMLLGKPLYILSQRKKKAKYGRTASNGDVNQGLELHPVVEGGDLSEDKSHSSHEEEEEFSEIMIHQGIHTVEYVLSTVSHTASYLRLWALSLAHAQLSEVLWGRVMKMAFAFHIGYAGAIFLFIIFFVWAFFTLAILVMMEGLSAFLHTLRLHWVEFQSKFYMGVGYAFQPFSFKDILDPSLDEDAD